LSRTCPGTAKAARYQGKVFLAMTGKGKI